MLPLLTSADIRKADEYTISHEPVASIDLMERAARAFVGWFLNHFPDKQKAIAVYCGTGNNGGDGLAIARMLHQHQYKNIYVTITRFSDKASADFTENLTRLQHTDVPFKEVNSAAEVTAENCPIIIDALLGSGLNKPLDGEYKHFVEYLNSVDATVVAIDVPTGFFAEGAIEQDAVVLKADLVITFQQPKINFLLPEASHYINCCEVVNIGLDEEFTRSLDSPYQYIEEKDIRKLLKPRKRFTNKGTYGHALIIAGEEKTMGAALLSSAGSAYAGAGLTSACIPASGLTALNSYLPELMAVIRDGNSLPDIKWDKYNSIAIGPGLGTGENALELLSEVLTNYKRPIVIDADGLNLIAINSVLFGNIPQGSILTPHMKEFDRLFGEHTSWWDRLQTARKQAEERYIYIILKNDYTITATPQGKLYFNSTSNAAMATGGMGDVLTGILASLLAQGYSSEDACLIGVYIHGKAGDELALPNRMNVVLPGKLAQQLPLTMSKLTV
ncbi:NAD(P)H-hydrate dehydratase [Mucilaginibacter limnophilus]|uniref:Bifunctional NAD(P)H-hydrate repair enzyme n=1 Tax=Mucilaginibacter limnophilus TaxID=1932778 RepID=A0A3S2UMM8_9SPHI|nr:NAD(P)H-hydrate dehydratase [Mucilaginibacter limnophilus]RVT98519.1 NAD(P)H-hydrate dehydratase [Mucilaginibacter limnophilus]